MFQSLVHTHDAWMALIRLGGLLKKKSLKRGHKVGRGSRVRESEGSREGKPGMSVEMIKNTSRMYVQLSKNR